MIESTALTEYVTGVWRDDIVPALIDYIAIPCVSVAFDPEWKAHGHIDDAVAMIARWCRTRRIAGLNVEVIEQPDRTPVVLMEIPAFGGADPEAPAVLLYGHLDKQPEMTGWGHGRGPWTPVIEGDRLYGRGGADDGYSAFASLTAIEALQATGGSHRRCVVLIEASEESGSPDLAMHVEALATRTGDVELVVCLDSGCLDYERLWVTTSLRGLVAGTLTVRVLEEGVHSGTASGIVPSSFRIARELLDRVEDSTTGNVLVPEMHVDIPSHRIDEARATANELPEKRSAQFKWAGGTRPMTDVAAEQLLAHTWRPTLSVIGADGFPPFDRSGNVLRPFTSLKLSFRLPPTIDASAAVAAVAALLIEHPPSGADVTFDSIEGADGWDAPPFAEWLRGALDDASTATFGAAARTFGEGGSIPFVGMLGDRFPSAQFIVTGVLGPESNAHGPNEFLHLPTARRVTTTIAILLGAHADT